MAARLVPIVLSFLVLAAHFLRSATWPGVIASLIAPLLLFVPRRWAARVLQALLVAGAIEWIRTLAARAAERSEAGEPWLRMAIILGAVAAVSLWSAWLVQREPLRRRYRLGSPAARDTR